jgi:hypothetical protein
MHMQAGDVNVVRDQAHRGMDARKPGQAGWSASKPKTAAEQAANAQLLYIVTALLILAFVGSLGPAIRPAAYGIDPAVRSWTPVALLHALSPIPQIGFLLLAMVSALGISTNSPSGSVPAAVSSVTNTLSHGERHCRRPSGLYTSSSKSSIGTSSSSSWAVLKVTLQATAQECLNVPNSRHALCPCQGSLWHLQCSTMSNTSSTKLCEAPLIAAAVCQYQHHMPARDMAATAVRYQPCPATTWR